MAYSKMYNISGVQGSKFQVKYGGLQCSVSDPYHLARSGSLQETLIHIRVANKIVIN